MEVVIFDQHFDKIIQLKHEQTKRDDEIKQREKVITQEIETKVNEINELKTKNVELEIETNSAKRNNEMLKAEVEDALREQLHANQKLVEVRMQGLDYKAEVDRRCDKVAAAIECQMGYVPDAVQKQLFYLQVLKVNSGSKQDISLFYADCNHNICVF
jgi:chromosome segregation ATPase